MFTNFTPPIAASMGDVREWVLEKEKGRDKKGRARKGRQKRMDCNH